MTRRTSRELLLAAGGLFAAFVALTLYVRFVGAIPGDERAIAWARDHAVRPQAVADVYSFFGTLGSTPIAILTLTAALAVLVRNTGFRDAALLAAAALVTPAERILVELVGTTDASIEVALAPGGFPSGHALYGTAVGGAIAVVGVRHRRPEVAVIAVGVGLAMATVPVLSGAHILSEVLASVLLGAAWLCLLVGAGRSAR